MNMRLTFMVAAIALCATLSQGCKFISVDKTKVSGFGDPAITIDSKNPNIKSQEFTSLAFSSISTKGGYNIEYHVGEERVAVSAPEAIMKHLVVKAENGVLSLGTDGSRINNWKDVNVVVYSQYLNGLNVSGAVDFKAKEIVARGYFTLEISGAGEVEIDSFQSEDVRIEVNGAGEIDIEGLQCNSIVAEINGAGELTLQGSAASAEFTVNGAGEIDIRKLDCSDVQTHKYGAASIKR